MNSIFPIAIYLIFTSIGVYCVWQSFLILQKPVKYPRSTRMRIVILILAVIVGILLYALPAHARTIQLATCADQENALLAAAIAERQRCDKDSDCIIAALGCPWETCQIHAVNTANSKTIESFREQFQRCLKTPDYRKKYDECQAALARKLCAPPPKAICKNQQCVFYEHPASR